MKPILLSLAATLAVAPAAHAFDAESYENGLWIGGVIATCTFLEGDDFKDPEFGAYMLRESFNRVPAGQRSSLITMWLDDESDKCVQAVR